MKPNNAITKIYQITSEALLTYFVLVPIFSSYDFPLPFWSYFAMVAVALILFEGTTRLIKNYVIYIPNMFILLLFSLYVFHYPTLAGIIFVGVLTWRTYVYDKHGYSEHQFSIILLTIVMLFFDLIFFYHPYLIWMGMSQLVISLGGYSLSHMLVTCSKGSRRSLLLPVSIVGSFLAGGFLLFLVYPVIQQIFSFIITGFLYLFSFFVYSLADILAWAGFEFESLKDMVNEESFKNFRERLGEQLEMDEDMLDMAESYTGVENIVNWWTIGLAVVVILIIGVIISRKRFRKAVTEDEIITNVSLHRINKPSASKRTFWPTFSSDKPVNQIRRRILEFERKTAEKGRGRNHSETIEEWFCRLRVDPSYLDLYQKVRYGHSELSEEETGEFYRMLEELKKALNL